MPSCTFLLSDHEYSLQQARGEPISAATASCEGLRARRPQGLKFALANPQRRPGSASMPQADLIVAELKIVAIRRYRRREAERQGGSIPSA
jgi:hypothetical protein